MVYVHEDAAFLAYASGRVKNPLCHQSAEYNASERLLRSCNVAKKSRGKNQRDRFRQHEIEFPKCAADTAVFLLYLLS